MYTRIDHNKLLSLVGKTAFITGGAVGIGEAIVRRLHAAGANVLVADLQQEKADALAAELNGQRDGSAAGFGLDVSVAAQVEAAFAHTIDRFGTIDILVNNAGIYPIIPLADMAESDFTKLIDINLRGVFLCTKAASDHMKQHDIKGSIINVTSIDALHPSMIGLAHYDASKHGVWGFTKNVALELAPHGIRVNALAPGAIATPGTGSEDGEQTEQLAAFLDKIPMARVGHPDEIAKATLFIASDLGSYMTGAQLVIDGGRLLA